jgi:hypothetical protein
MLSPDKKVHLSKIFEAARDLLKVEACSGDEKALNILVHEAVEWNYAVDSVRISNIEVTRKIARRMPYWPGNLAAHPAAIDDAMWLCREIKLACDHENFSVAGPAHGPARARLDSPAQTISVDIKGWIDRTRNRGLAKASSPWEQNACKLAPLTDKATFKHWFNCGWEWYSACLEGDVANDPYAKAIAGKRRKGRNKDIGYVKDQVSKASAWWLKKNPVRG